jgi:putative ABC transport system permease protein
MLNIRDTMGRLSHQLRNRPVRPARQQVPVTKNAVAARASDWFYSFLSMLTLVYKRLSHNLGLSVSAVIGVVAVMAIVVCIPIFSHAVSSKVLREQLIAKAVTSGRGLFSLNLYYLDRASQTPFRVQTNDAIVRFIEESIGSLLALKIDRIYSEMETASLRWTPVRTKTAQNPDEIWFNMALQSADVVRENGFIIDGAWPEVNMEGPVQVAVLESAADEFFLNVGDIYRYHSLEIEITGIWRPIESGGSIWAQSPLLIYRDKLWIPQETYRNRLDPILDRSIMYISWYVVMDEQGLRFDRAPQYARGLVNFDTDMRRLLPGVKTDYSPLDALQAYQERADTLTTLFYAVSGPMIILALLFVSLTATIHVQQYEQETATIRGRGTSWPQVAALNLIESAVLIILAIPLALLFGWLAALIMGYTQSFLRFELRDNLIVNLQGINYLWLALSALFIVIARFLPVMGISRTTIVRVKQEQSRGTRKPIWQRFYLDFFLLIPGIYAYITMSGLAKPLRFLAAVQPQPGETYRDPLLFVAPSLFAMALCMISLRILPWIMRWLAKAVDNMPRVWAYLSLQQVARRPQEYTSALLLIMISLSLAIYSASSAKTLDKWLHDSAYYQHGADLVVRQFILETSGGTAFGPAAGGSSSSAKRDLSVEGFFDVNEYLRLPSIENVTRVGQYTGTFSFGLGEKPARFIGIERLEFPKVAFYRDDFARQPLGALLNAMAIDPNGVLVPQVLMEELGLRVGDRLNVDVMVLDQSASLDVVIAGVYDYFPTVMPDRRPTIIINLDTIFDHPESVINYDLWLDVREGTDVNLLMYQMRNMIDPNRGMVEIRGNAYGDVQEMMERPERVGLFGILNVGFIATGLMPGIGFVLYSYASLRRRFIQLGILQAIGLSVKQLVGYIVLEQFLLMSLAISIGAAVGLITSNLFVPFLQVNASRTAPVPPFEVLIGWAESGWLSLAFGLVLFLTILGTIWYLAQMKVFQAVKMGEAM